MQNKKGLTVKHGLITSSTNTLQHIKRKKKIAELKIEQAQTEAINDVRTRVASLSYEITKSYLSENLDKKVSETILDDSITEVKKNL